MCLVHVIMKLRKEEKASLDVALRNAKQINEFRKRRLEIEDEGPEKDAKKQWDMSNSNRVDKPSNIEVEDEGIKDHGKKPQGMPSSNSVEKLSNNETPPMCSEPQDETSPSCFVDFCTSEREESFVSPERKAIPYADEMLKVAGGLEDSG